MYGFFTNGYKKPVKKMFLSICNQKECIDAFPKDVANVINKSDKENNEVKDALNMYSSFYDEDMKDVGYEIIDKTKIQDEKLKKAEKEVNQFVENNGEENKKDIKVTDGYIMAIKVNYKIKDEEYNTFIVVSTYKMNDSWGIWYNK